MTNKLNISKNNHSISIPYVIWEDILKIVYVRDKRLFSILKSYTEQLNQKDFDMDIVTYRLKLRMNK